jgi:ubiquitin-like domain-containing CTD phosphatase 1
MFLQQLAPVSARKKLLVLDLDHTLFNNTVDKLEPVVETLRPYMDMFLERAFKNYNLVLWSASSMRRIKRKLEKLGLQDQKYYKYVI